jgi:hypothetical protein
MKMGGEFRGSAGGESLSCPLERMSVWSRGALDTVGESKSLLPLPGMEPWLCCCQFHSPVFLILDCEAIGTAATPGLLCQPRVTVKMIVEKQVECRLAGETEVLGENLPQLHFCPSQNPTLPDPGLNPARRGGKPATNSLSYGAANIPVTTSISTELMHNKTYFALYLCYIF